jgi:hypothetical protein
MTYFAPISSYFFASLTFEKPFLLENRYLINGYWLIVTRYWFSKFLAFNVLSNQ